MGQPISVTKPTSSIELNGKRYDSRTGRLLGDAPAAQTPMPSAGTSVDGFFSAPVRTVAPIAKAVHPSSAAKGQVSTSVIDICRPAAQSLSHHKPQHSNTLMRKSVNKPSPSLKRQLKVATATTSLVPAPRFDIVPKQSVATVDPGRLKHARQVSRSDMVTRFGVIPAQARSIPSTSRTVSPNAAQTAPRHIAPAPIRTRQPSADIFERALASASSHTQAPVKTKHAPRKKTHRLRRVASVAASSLAILLIVGFVAYLNQTALQMRLASSRAGISATLPHWQPTGFTIGSFSYKPNTVTVSFHGATDPARTFSLSQTASNWDSSALLSDFVLPNAQTYQTIETQGTTIYTYGNNNATWVNGGIWYTLTTNGSLSTTDIVRLAVNM